LQQAVGLLATMATFAVAAFTWISIHQVSNEQAITLEGQITDRYNTAVSDLGGSADVRIGSIYALQRIMNDSPRDQPAIISVLSAYIRTRDLLPKDGHGPSQLAPDITAALTVLAARNPRHDGTARIDLHNTDLTGANLADANLNHTNLTHANLAGANLNGAFLTYANLTGANLAGADLTDVDLTTVLR
jgi:Pentapeptide repeats (8 copies)